MDITFTDSELDFINSVTVDAETVEDVVHRLILPMVKEHGEDRLQTLANIYRALDPDQQVKALAVLKTWLVAEDAAAKAAVVDPVIVAPVPPVDPLTNG